MIGFFIACLIPAVVMTLLLYLNHSDSLLRLFRFARGQTVISDMGAYFMRFLLIQTGFAMFATAFAAPTLISPDLANNALPLYLCRPLSRVEYVAGKFCVIAFLLSLITWVPGMLMFAVEASLAGRDWTWDHLWIANAILLSSLIYIAVLSFLGLALSAWVKWKPIAGALVLGVFFLGAGFGAAVNAVMRTKSGYFLDIGHRLGTVRAQLFRASATYDAGVPVMGAVAQLITVCAICAWMLSRKTRAFEVVR
jgi:ABC-2 type transport system permease protein